MTNKTKTWIAVLAATSLVSVLAQLPAAAQTPAQSDCTARPPSSSEANRKAEKMPDLSDKLDKCNGELKAPPVGDGDIIEPAPDTGNSRIVKPGQLPSGANPSNGSDGTKSQP
ncbi:hypothetical protein [Neorhizobium sp. NCHU2750]|uniref:hypothetical protein n=1 Tax=Neorhizobium sp. NCHU2750 TaxID=1825976 RepID=UPI000EB6626F|nr:hypothetical protein NCHU2750_53180 [Neorhizobium sp. NCHU2750]